MIVRKLLLWIAGGVRKETYTKLRQEHAKQTRVLRRVRRIIRFGGTCPVCGRSYSIQVDITTPLKGKEQRIVHCTHCKKHPVVWWYSPYEITEVKEME